MYVCVHMSIKQQLMEREYKFERKQGRVYGRVCREEREGGNGVNTL